ncbi:AI-2E family transporter [Botrimarina mediterranea]|uniref:Putative inner membrane protein n=1 Tax=Botrimarina mediterranea TaxID=2528022 RepID=A0A518K8T6_9BACT|nr:AI-2E family transporter [Botrimarina mediterranea]QDV74208.1 putative inner membrane protein [Botrimarina mediterranea]QDV78839.1 putative inner membrane protein [Planctomycetes bacterium K2D]
MSKSKPTPPAEKPEPSEGSDIHSIAEAIDDAPPLSVSMPGVPRVISLIVLVAVLLGISVLFFRVMATFLVPLFLAAVLTVVFKPLHVWILNKVGGRNQLAALATTTLITLGVVVPTALLGWMAFVETSQIVRVVQTNADTEAPAAAEGEEDSVIPDGVDHKEEQEDAAEDEAAGGVGKALTAWMQPFAEWYRVNMNEEFEPAKLAQNAAQQVVKVGWVGVQALVGFLVGMAIMIFALYFFLADGPKIVETLMHLSPLDDDYERELLVQFATVSRAVVLATLLSAFVQGILGGIGYYFVIDDWAPANALAQYGGDIDQVPENLRIHPPVILLTVLTMLLAIVPFVGATAVWIPVALWVYFAQGDLWPAIGMTIYGFAVVSSIDNLIKPWVLHGQSNLHPLLALLSVLGGLQLLGPIGILVGPMLVAFMQALLLMLRKELDVIAEEAEENGDSVPKPA